MTRGIFISYRRTDSESATDRLRERLQSALTGHPVFVDIYGIAPGDKFQQTLEEKLAQSVVFLAVIGMQWAKSFDEKRAEGAVDYVLIEVEKALAMGVKVIPVLVQGASLPKKTDLPDSIGALVDCQTFECRRISFNADADQLADGIRKEIEKRLQARDASLVAREESLARHRAEGQSLQALHPKVDEVLALLKSSEAFQKAQRAGISEEAVRKIVARLGGEGVADEDLLPWLENWIEVAIQKLGQSTNEDEAFEAARQEADRRFRAGKTDASAALMEEFDREERVEAERQDERKRRRLRLLEEAVRFDELSLSFDALVAKLRLVASIEGVGASGDLSGFLEGRARNYYERGERSRDNTALLAAIATLRAALEEIERERDPPYWAVTQMHLGNALQTLGDREQGTARLEEALVAYRAALEVQTPEMGLLYWAQTQLNLGAALRKLGGRGTGTILLKRAVKTYRAVLREITRETLPALWRQAQTNLAIALRDIGDRKGENGTGYLRDAATAFRAALSVTTPRSTPSEEANTRMNFGLFLATLGEFETDTAFLENGVAICTAALEEIRREATPIPWGLAQLNLAVSLEALGNREEGTVCLEKAAAALRAALEELTPEQHAEGHRKATRALGRVLETIKQRRSGS